MFCDVSGRLATIGGCLAMFEDVWNINQFIASLFINKFQLVLRMMKFQLVLRMMQSYQEARGWAGAGLELGWALL